MCSWCEAGDITCDKSSVTEIHPFPVSISPNVNGRSYPIWSSPSQPPLQDGDSGAKVAIIVHHGAGRNGFDYASYMLGALALLNQTDHSAVFGAQVFEIGDEYLDIDHHIWWDSDGLDDDGLDPLFGEYNWKWGGESTRNLPETISTFKVLDEMIETLRDPALYPILERILVAGHSAGGQIVQRYALFNLVDDDPTKIPIEYFVANPSSAVYLSPERPVLPPSSTKTCSSFCDNFTIPETIYEFAVPPQSSDLKCGGEGGSYNSYGYGLDHFSAVKYCSQSSTSSALAQYQKRRVTYMSGSSDVCDLNFQIDNDCTPGCTPDDGGLDPSCEAEAAGWCRMSRLHAFKQHVDKVYEEGGHVHKLLEVPFVGHSGCGMFQSKEFSDILVGKGVDETEEWWIGVLFCVFGLLLFVSSYYAFKKACFGEGEDQREKSETLRYEAVAVNAGEKSYDFDKVEMVESCGEKC
ncbi:hypothetical protein ScalyP_jg9849 [Parmales sp. scaly parma]|nr:hypothetical protein ScalyP_jg9849 [Parmales sp. scaly parma]